MTTKNTRCIALRENYKPCASFASDKAVSMANVPLCASHWKSYKNELLVTVKINGEIKFIKKPRT